MIIVDNVSLAEEVKNLCFECDLTKCKGACCVEGDEGAPLEENEISIIEDYLDKIKPYMEKAGIEVVEKFGAFDYGADGSFVTPLVNDAECAFVMFENDIAYCAIERAYRNGDIDWVKPISCHLYPIRIQKHAAFDAALYHRWPICDPALENGKKIGDPLYITLKDPLVRAYGKDWYKQLVVAVKEYK